MELELGEVGHFREFYHPVYLECLPLRCGCSWQVDWNGRLGCPVTAMSHIYFCEDCIVLDFNRGGLDCHQRQKTIEHGTIQLFYTIQHD